MLLAYSWLSMALGLAQMVLDVQKNLELTHFYMLNNLCINNFPKKMIPRDVRAHVLQEPVEGSHTRDLLILHNSPGGSLFQYL